MESVRRQSILSLKVLLGCLGLLLLLLFLSPQKAEAAFEDGSTYPPDVINTLDYFCWWGNSEGRSQRSANVTWLSAAGNPSQTNITINQGQPFVSLEFHTITKRCHLNQEIDGITTNFIPWSGQFTNLSNGQVTAIPSFTEGGGLSRDARMIVNPSPQPPGPLYSRESKAVTLSTFGLTATTTFRLSVGSKQYADRYLYPFNPAYGGDRYPCVPSISDIQNGINRVLTNPTSDADNCSTVPITNDITIVVQPTDAAPQVSFTHTCDSVNITALDSDSPSRGAIWVLELDGVEIQRGQGSTTYTDMANYKDAYQHNLTIVYYSVNSAGNATGNPTRTSAQSWGPCAQPTCAVNLDPVAPEPNATYTATITITDNRNAQGRRLDYRYNITLPSPGGGTFSGGPYTMSANPQSASYHHTGTSPPSSGNFNITANVTKAGAPEYSVNCSGDLTLPVALKPYFKTYGGGVIVGSQFGSPCAVRTSSIRAFTQELNINSNQWRGASSQFAAHALGTIDGFFTAGMRNTATPSVYDKPTAPTGLSFGNHNGAFVGVNAGGSDTSGAAKCLPDYFSEISSGGVPGSVFNLAVDNVAAFDKTTRELSFSNGLMNSPGLYYYDGDLTIKSDIRFDDRGLGWTDEAGSYQLPYFYLVVKGNITIDSSVRQIDGVYIAQPRRDVANNQIDGTIDTCSGAFPCVNKLTVNGAFIARQAKLRRINGTLNAGEVNENKNDTNIAEVFNFSPDVLLGGPKEFTSYTDYFVKYDSIVGLPPVL